LEGAAQIGRLIYWTGSHGRDGGGERREERQVLFATELAGLGEKTTLKLVNEVPYEGLLDRLQNDPALAKLHLADAFGTKKKDPTKGPKEPGALNIESLCPGSNGLLIGFRNPLIREGMIEKAILLPLLNPEAVVRGKEAAKFAKPILLDLGGLGIRGMAPWRGEYLIIGGDYRDRFDAEAKPTRLFRWKGGGQDPAIDLMVEFGDLNPEAIVTFGDTKNPRVLILSDDGGMKVEDGKTNKKHPPAQQFFRAVWFKAGKE
jgi:hypothetical protein